LFRETASQAGILNRIVKGFQQESSFSDGAILVIARAKKKTEEGDHEDRPYE